MTVHFQERRKEFEANLEKAGLELETEDKSVRSSTAEKRRPLQEICRWRSAVCRRWS